MNIHYENMGVKERRGGYTQSFTIPLGSVQLMQYMDVGSGGGGREELNMGHQLKMKRIDLES
jgi:hypothetical protein